MKSDTIDLTAPVAIGGMGGSGTRLVARIALDLGFYLGSDLNRALDNLWFTLLFKRAGVLGMTEKEFSELVSLFASRMQRKQPGEDPAEKVRSLGDSPRPGHSVAWLEERVESFLCMVGHTPTLAPWGWKEPNTHIIFDRLYQHIPGIKYIHVVRNGLDMAHSKNQNQLKFWGEFILGESVEYSPRTSLTYWCAMHRRLLSIAANVPEDQFLLLNYDKLCRDPSQELARLMAFLGVSEQPSKQMDSLKEQIVPPASMGRYQHHGLNQFLSADIAFVEQMGFDVA